MKGEGEGKKTLNNNLKENNACYGKSNLPFLSLTPNRPISTNFTLQHAKKLVSNNLGLVDFAFA